MELDPDVFEWQVDWLLDNRQIVNLEDAVSRWGESESERLVVLTFDDGYKDTYEIAYPILRKRNIPFTIYLSTDSIETGKPLTTEGEATPLGWEDLRVMLSSGLMTLGAHTHTHADLRQLSESQINEELQISDDLLEDRLGQSPSHFAYPWGYWSDYADRAVRTRYSSAVLGAPHINGRSTGLDPHRLFRFPVQRSDGKRWFRARLDGGLLLEEEVRRRLRGYKGP